MDKGCPSPNPYVYGKRAVAAVGRKPSSQFNLERGCGTKPKVAAFEQPWERSKTIHKLKADMAMSPRNREHAEAEREEVRQMG
jgi:hypothetical protein